MNPKYFTRNNKAYENFIRSKPCIVCKRESECHHVEHGRRNSYYSVPLCREHHNVYHSRGGKASLKLFQDEYNIDIKNEVINLLSEFIHENI